MPGDLQFSDLAASDSIAEAAKPSTAGHRASRLSRASRNGGSVFVELRMA
jgi:hypothetical protein